MNPLERILWYLESKKAEFVLEQQQDWFGEWFEANMNESIFEDVPEEHTVKVGDKHYYRSVNSNNAYLSATSAIEDQYQMMTNFINFLRKLEWDDFEPYYFPVHITIDRSQYQREGFELTVKESSKEKKDYVGKRDPELLDGDDDANFLKLNEPLEQVEFYEKERVEEDID